MAPDNDPVSAPQPSSPSDDDPKRTAPAPDADKAEPQPHERPPVRSDDN